MCFPLVKESLAADNIYKTVAIPIAAEHINGDILLCGKLVTTEMNRLPYHLMLLAYHILNTTHNE